PLTERIGASKLVFLSNHCCADNSKTQVNENLSQDSTLVFYMPGADLAELSEQLLRNGLAEELPCLLVCNVARGAQHLVRTDLCSLSSLASQPSPSLLIVGPTVNSALFNEYFTDTVSVHKKTNSCTEILTLDEPASECRLQSKLTV